MTPKEKVEELKQKFQESYNQGKLHEQCVSIVVEECISAFYAIYDDCIKSWDDYEVKGGMREFWEKAKEELNLEQKNKA